MITALKKYLTNDSPFSDVSRYATAEATARAELLVSAFYYFLLFVSVGLFSAWNPVGVMAQAQTVFIWPLFWIPFVEPVFAYTVIRVFFMGASLAVAFFPHVRLFRIASFIGLLEFSSLYLGALQLEVDGFGLVITSFLLIFLPSKRLGASEIQGYREKYLLAFWSLIAANLLTYSMGGIGKLVGWVEQLRIGESHYFSLHAAALHIADRLVLTDATSAIGAWAVAHPLLILPWFLFTLYLLLFSLFAAFRPKIHRVWGLLLLLFHVGNYLVINIGFVAHVFLWCLLLVASPFAPQKTTLSEILRHMPIFDLWFRFKERAQP